MRPRKPRADRRALRIARCLVPLRRHLVQRKGFSAGGGSLLRRVQLPHPSGESFDLRKLRPNDSPPVAVTAGLRRQAWIVTRFSRVAMLAWLARRCRHGPLRFLPEIFRLPQAPPEKSPSVRPAARPLQARLLRCARRAPVICSVSSCVGQESRLLKPACRSAQTPSGVFLFSGRFAPSSQRVAAFRPPLWLNLICPAQAPDKSDSASAPELASLPSFKR